MCEVVLNRIAEELNKIKPAMSAPLCEHFVFDRIIGVIEKTAQEEMTTAFSPTRFRNTVYAKMKRNKRPLSKHEAKRML